MIITNDEINRILLEKFGSFTAPIIHCKQCNKKINKELKYLRIAIKKNTDPNLFCNISCSNKYRTKKNNYTRKPRKKKLGIIYCNVSFCKTCGKSIPYLRRKTCSDDCLSKRLQGVTKARKPVKRSKNEIYFSELCADQFGNVLTNVKMFNGWDADVIIEDRKTAIHWNGVWHYKDNLSKTHSLKQVQNRDLLKMKEIKSMGYDSYVIKDMGKHDKRFVEERFSEFKILMLKRAHQKVAVTGVEPAIYRL